MLHCKTKKLDDYILFSTEMGTHWLSVPENKVQILIRRFHMSCVTCRMSHVTCHMSVTPIDTATDPQNRQIT